MSYTTPQELSEAAGAFETALVEDKTEPAPGTDTTVLDRYVSPIVLPYYKDPLVYPIDLEPGVGEIKYVSLRPWRGPLSWRLKCQLEDVRKRMSNPDAMILVVRGTNYSAENIDDLLKLYFENNPKTEETALVSSSRKTWWGRIKDKIRNWRSKS